MSIGGGDAAFAFPGSNIREKIPSKLEKKLTFKMPNEDFDFYAITIKYHFYCIII